MKSLLKITSLFLLFFVFSCSTDSSSSSAETTSTPSSSTATTTPAVDKGPVLSQEVPITRVEVSGTGTEEIITYLVNGKNLTEEMVAPNGLNNFEAVIANMMTLASGKCAQNAENVSFVLLNNENKLQGRYDWPCSYIHRVFRTLGSGDLKEYPTVRGENTEVISTNQLTITAANLSSFQNIVRGLEPAEHNGVKVGEVF